MSFPVINKASLWGISKICTFLGLLTERMLSASQIQSAQEAACFHSLFQLPSFIMSMDDIPPSSQPVSNPRIFFYQTDVPIPVFVEASSIRNRPKLIRSLRVCKFRCMGSDWLLKPAKSLELRCIDLPWPCRGSHHSS